MGVGMVYWSVSQPLFHTITQPYTITQPCPFLLILFFLSMLYIAAYFLHLFIFPFMFLLPACLNLVCKPVLVIHIQSF